MLDNGVGDIDEADYIWLSHGVGWRKGAASQVTTYQVLEVVAINYLVVNHWGAPL